MIIFVIPVANSFLKNATLHSPFRMFAIIIANVMCVALASHLIAIGNKVQDVNATPCELSKNAPRLKDSWQIIIPNV